MKGTKGFREKQSKLVSSARHAKIERPGDHLERVQLLGTCFLFKKRDGVFLEDHLHAPDVKVRRRNDVQFLYEVLFWKGYLLCYLFGSFQWFLH